MKSLFPKNAFTSPRRGNARIPNGKWKKCFTTGAILFVVGVLPYILIYWAFLPEWLGRIIVLCIVIIVFNGWFLLAPVFKWGFFRDLTDKATIPTKTVRGMIHLLRIPVFIVGIICLWVMTRPLFVGVFSLARGESMEKRVVRLHHIRTVGLAHHVRVQDGESYLLLYGNTMPGKVPYELVLLPRTNFVLEWKAVPTTDHPTVPMPKTSTPSENGK